MQDQSDWALDELERLINDPTVPLRAGRVWELAEMVARPGGAWSHHGEKRIEGGGGGVLLA